MLNRGFETTLFNIVPKISSKVMMLYKFFRTNLFDMVSREKCGK